MYIPLELNTSIHVHLNFLYLCAVGRTPVDVCFSPDCRKAIKKHVSRLPKMVKTGLPLTSDIKRDMFNAADSQTGLYQLAILLQVISVSIN